MDHSSTSPTLLARIQAADAHAWPRLVELYGPLVYQWARKAGQQPADAADTVQEVFQQVHRNIGKFQPRNGNGSFRGWLWTITRHKVTDQARRRQQQPQASGGSSAHARLAALPELVAQEHTVEGRSEIGGIRRRALEAIQDEFEPQVWQCFWRVIVAGESPIHIAEDLGVSKWAVYKAKARVLQRLRAELGDLL